MKENVYCL